MSTQRKQYSAELKARRSARARRSANHPPVVDRPLSHRYRWYGTPPRHPSRAPVPLGPRLRAAARGARTLAPGAIGRLLRGSWAGRGGGVGRARWPGWSCQGASPNVRVREAWCSTSVRRERRLRWHSRRPTHRYRSGMVSSIRVVHHWATATTPRPICLKSIPRLLHLSRNSCIYTLHSTSHTLTLPEKSRSSHRHFYRNYRPRPPRPAAAQQPWRRQEAEHRDRLGLCGASSSVHHGGSPLVVPAADVAASAPAGVLRPPKGQHVTHRKTPA